ncbi:MAG: Fe-S protein assembly co-chaperone HscB [Planctomycetes bacterium]|nr:Fe-S protein assembly co-chaperone HscB [Planctomycetota bacterium]
MDHFERLGLPRRFSLTDADIERQYLARSREVHPDFYQSAGDLEQRASMELSAGLNEAYTVLRDPFRRAEYLLQLQGGPTAAEMKEMPAAFLEEMLELRMEIEEIKFNQDSPEFAAMEKQLADRREKLLNDVGSLFERNVGEPLKEIRRLLNATKYVQGLIRDLHAD